MLIKKSFISVSEPWDFESQDGQNVILGTIIDKKSNHCLVFKSNNHLKLKESAGDILILSPRHEGNDFSYLDKKIISVNCCLLLIKYGKELSEDELINNAKFEIIGSVSKI